MNKHFLLLWVFPIAFIIALGPAFPSHASEISTPSDALEETGSDDTDSGSVDNSALEGLLSEYEQRLAQMDELNSVLEDSLDEYEWRMMQMDESDGSYIDNASIFQISENTSDIIQLLHFTDFLLILLLGALLASIFSRYFISW